MHRLDDVTPLDEMMAAFTDMVRAGKVRYIGGSSMPAWRFAQMIMLAEWKGYARPIAMQNLYNLIQREEEREMIPLCLEQGVGLIPYSPLARGFLAANRAQSGGGETERSKTDNIVKPGTYRDCDFAIAAPAGHDGRARRQADPGGAGVDAGEAGDGRRSSAPPSCTGDDAAAATEITRAPREIKAPEEPHEFRVPPRELIAGREPACQARAVRGGPAEAPVPPRQPDLGVPGHADGRGCAGADVGRGGAR